VLADDELETIDDGSEFSRLISDQTSGPSLAAAGFRRFSLIL
jgi:hypothetical protein